MQEINDKSAWRHRAAEVTTFKYLSPVELDILLGKSDILSYHADEPILKEDEISPWFFAILQGTVNVSVEEATLDGALRNVYMCTLGPGDVFGEAGLFIKVKRTASVSAAQDVTLLRLQRSDLSAFIRSQPVGGNKLLLVVIYSLLRKLRAANQELAYERKADMDQADVDSLMADMMGD
ncbi:MAG: hypothetical protein CVV51_09505 [Spirochaetae bacterium HGW-Spirochaetae-7]|jgi:CRP-like cAMP-binding protein|nr:MAG: hypothetical protein CVV51_09505 [Spirochaetae bacterium HGW-Spirochaetae-7]